MNNQEGESAEGSWSGRMLLNSQTHHEHLLPAHWLADYFHRKQHDEAAETSCKSAQSWKGKLCTTEVMKTLVITNKEQEPQARTHLLACFQHGVTPLHLQGRRTLLPHFWFCSAISPSPDRVGCIQILFYHQTKQHTLALLLGWRQT